MRHCSTKARTGLMKTAQISTAQAATKVATGRAKASMRPALRRRAGSFPQRFRARFSVRLMVLPMPTTGWGSHKGSPSRASAAMPTAMAATTQEPCRSGQDIASTSTSIMRNLLRLQGLRRGRCRLGCMPR